MDANSNALPIGSGYAQNEQFVRQLLEDIANGDIPSEMPPGRDAMLWSELDVARLNKAMIEILGHR